MDVGVGGGVGGVDGDDEGLGRGLGRGLEGLGDTDAILFGMVDGKELSDALETLDILLPIGTVLL